MVLRYKTPLIELEFREHLHSRVTNLAKNFTGWSYTAKLPEPVITDVIRTDQQTVDLYVPYILGLLRRAERGGRDGDGKAAPLTLGEEQSVLKYTRLAAGNPGMERSHVAALWALGRFSWHRCGCAADFRNNHYEPAQLKDVVAWFRREIAADSRHGQPSPWEFLSHDIGAGHHLHVGFKDTIRQHAFNETRQTTLEGLVIPPG